MPRSRQSTQNTSREGCPPHWPAQHELLGALEGWGGHDCRSCPLLSHPPAAAAAFPGGPRFAGRNLPQIPSGTVCPPTTGRWSDQWLFMAFIQGLHQDPDRLRHLQFLQTRGPVLLSVLTGISNSDQSFLSSGSWPSPLPCGGTGRASVSCP